MKTSGADQVEPVSEGKSEVGLRRVAQWLIGVTVSLLGLFLLWTHLPVGELLVRESYDSLHRTSGASFSDLSVVIVYLDLPSHHALGVDPNQPWPRALHAKLLQRLTASGARAVVFDIVFGEAGPDPTADRELTQAIRDHGKVILAGELADASQRAGIGDWGRSTTTIPPNARLLAAAAGWGLGELRVDHDFGVRRHFPGMSDPKVVSLSMSTARLLQLESSKNQYPSEDRWIRHYGPPLTLPHVSYSQALNPADLGDSFFRDKVVFVGARPWAGSIGERRDEFRGPFRNWGAKDLFAPGVEMHATQFLNLLRNDWLRRLPLWIEGLLALGIGALAGNSLTRLRPLSATFFSLVGSSLVFGFATIAFQRGGVWFPWMNLALVQIPTALFGTVLYHSLEWYRARKRLEAARRIATARILEQASLIDKAHDAIMVQDRDGKIVYANQSAVQLFGWPTDALQRVATAAELFAVDQPKIAEADRVTREKGEWTGELRFSDSRGQIVLVNSRWTLIRDDLGQVKSLLMVNSDITEKRQMEAQILRSQRMETIGSIAGGMAHDLNNALSPILMGVQLLRRRAHDDDRNLLELMESSTQRGAEMVRQVLHFARGRDGDIERLNLRSLIREIEKMVRETFPRSIRIEVIAPEDLWDIRGNSTQLHQILLNLCVNARDAMPLGGRLSIAADNVEWKETPPDAPGDLRHGQFVCLLVMDTGTGISPEVRTRIFEPFFTTKGDSGGTGMGLATVNRLVKQHGGFIRVESEAGQGSSFEIFLPRAIVESPKAGPRTTPEEWPQGHGEIVWVIEKEQAIRELIAEGLVTHGFRVLTVATGDETRKGFPTEIETPSLCFLGSGTDGHDGQRWLEEWQCRHPRVPWVVAGEMESSLNRLLNKAGVIRIGKPFAMNEVLLAVQQGLKQYDAANKLGKS